MKKNKDDSFFAFLSFYAVHGPIQTQEEKWAKYRQKTEEQGIAEQGFAMERNLPIRQHQDNPVYAGLIENMDEEVGVLLDGLAQLNLDKNTIIVFTLNNGGVASGDSFSTSNSPFRGGKGYQWEGRIREPYFIYVPDVETKTIDTPVTGSDFYPTFLDLANLDLLPNQHKDGKSLKPLIYDEAEFEERPLFWHFPHYGKQGSDPSSIIRLGDWKLIEYYEVDNQQLMDHLDEVGSKFPKPDPKFDAEKCAKYMKHVGEKQTTYSTQSTFVIPVEDKKDVFIFFTDRWVPDKHSEGRYIWLPVLFNEEGIPYLNWFEKWDMSVFD